MYFCVKFNCVYTKEEKKQLVINFWSEFSQYCFENKYLKGKKRKWMLNMTKVSNVHLMFYTGRDCVQVILEVMHKSETARLNMYERLEQCKPILENSFIGGLIWNFAYTRDNGQEVCRIYTEKQGLDIHRKEQWPEMFQFMAENMFRLEKNFLEMRDYIVD